MAHSCCVWNCRSQNLPRPTPRKLRSRGFGNLNRTLKLSARSEDIATTRSSHESGYPSLHQDLLKSPNTILRRSRELDSWAGIQSDEVHFAPQPAQQFHDFPRIADLVIHAI